MPNPANHHVPSWPEHLERPYRTEEGDLILAFAEYALESADDAGVQVADIKEVQEAVTRLEWVLHRR